MSIPYTPSTCNTHRICHTVTSPDNKICYQRVTQTKLSMVWNKKICFATSTRVLRGVLQWCTGIKKIFCADLQPSDYHLLLCHCAISLMLNLVFLNPYFQHLHWLTSLLLLVSLLLMVILLLLMSMLLLASMLLPLSMLLLTPLLLLAPLHHDVATWWHCCCLFCPRQCWKSLLVPGWVTFWHFQLAFKIWRLLRQKLQFISPEREGIIFLPTP